MLKSRLIRRGDWVIIKIVENGTHDVLFSGKAQMSDLEGVKALLVAARERGFDIPVGDGWWD
jgi:hypothetical protein